MSLQEMIAAEKAAMKQIRKNKKAMKAMAKAKRKLRSALRANTMNAIRINLGMAQVALQKAEFLAKGI